MPAVSGCSTQGQEEDLSRSSHFYPTHWRQQEGHSHFRAPISSQRGSQEAQAQTGYLKVARTSALRYT
jgi:hypothetical protein